MRAWVIVVLLVIIGIVAAWVGYWIGHALGWTTDAEFPLTIGAGDRAIGLSILVSFGSVMLGVWWFVARPLSRIRRLLATGSPGRATVHRAWRTGLYIRRRPGDARRELAFQVEVHPAVGAGYPATAYGLLTEAEEAAVTPGTDVDVRYDPARPTDVVVVGPLTHAG
jgi:hypothetical protein